jgi:hypothetical protein
LLLWSTNVFAHAHLVDPPSRTNPPVSPTTGPCDGPKTTTAVNYSPGEQIMVTWQETVQHPNSTFRIAWSATDMGFGMNILLDNIPEQVGTAPVMYQQMVTLPSTPCPSCTLQLVQTDPGTTPPTKYYSCADITIGAAAGMDGGPTGSDGGPTGADAHAPGSDGGGGGTNNQIGNAPGLCEISGPASSSGWSAIWLGALALFLRFALRRK